MHRYQPVIFVAAMVAAAIVGPSLISLDTPAIPAVASSQSESQGRPPLQIVQPVQKYFLPFGRGVATGKLDQPYVDALPSCTHLGTKFGRMGPGQCRLSWKPGEVDVELPPGEWAGMWHSLAGATREEAQHFDFLRCYPSFIRAKYQPRCVGITVRAEGKGTLKIEIASARKDVLWQRRQQVASEGRIQDLVVACRPEELREAKYLNWVAEPGAHLRVHSIGLQLEFPPMALARRVFLVSYAKLARCYAQDLGIARDRADFPAGQFDNVPASGLFCLATCAAWRMGIVEQRFAEQTLRRIHHTVAQVPRALGLLPHFIHKDGGRYRIYPGSEYSTIDTSIYYHSMLLAAQMLADEDTLAGLRGAVRQIRFDQLRDADGFALHGLQEDGHTRLRCSWQDWGGETALVLLLERMAGGDRAPLKMSRSGKVFGGVGFIGEIQSLFYPDFALDEPDAVSGVNWLRARRELLQEQMSYFPKTQPRSAAAGMGLYGLSAGEGLHGDSYACNGTQLLPAGIIHPHYILMSGLLRPVGDINRLLRTMEAMGLIGPWGMVENVQADLSEYLPWNGSLNASFECLGAYHLWASETGCPDQIYQAAGHCRLLREAIQAFFPHRGGATGVAVAQTRNPSRSERVTASR